MSKRNSIFFASSLVLAAYAVFSASAPAQANDPLPTGAVAPGTAFAASEPVQLIDTQLDAVTAGGRTWSGAPLGAITPSHRVLRGAPLGAITPRGSVWG